MTTPSEQTATLAQYKLMVEMADRISGRRQATNTFFFSIVSLLTVANGFAWVLPRWQHPPAVPIPRWQHTLAITAGTILVCYAWVHILRTYRAINSAKFAVIMEIEKTLPFAMFEDEDKHMKSQDRHRYAPLTVIEERLPWMFAGLSVLIGATTIVPLVCSCL